MIGKRMNESKQARKKVCTYIRCTKMGMPFSRLMAMAMGVGVGVGVRI